MMNAIKGDGYIFLCKLNDSERKEKCACDHALQSEKYYLFNSLRASDAYVRQ